MYPDARYANISQAEINEAKKRHEARQAVKAVAAPVVEKGKPSIPKDDHKHIPYKTEKPLYP